MPLTHLLDLHGFRSSPQSAKARIMAQHMATHNPEVQWWSPQLPPSPRAAIDMLMDGIQHWPRASMAVMLRPRSRAAVVSAWRVCRVRGLWSTAML